MTSLSLVANQAAKNGSGTSPTGLGPTSMSFAEGSQPQVSTPNLNGLDTFQGGLAINAHGELRFYVRLTLSPFSSVLGLTIMRCTGPNILLPRRPSRLDLPPQHSHNSQRHPRLLAHSRSDPDRLTS
jgi:hypothetical protein